ncbi:MAG: 4Fe-4S binding protein [Desulfobacteraceae bacterium]|nr:4Fe-4S binding protein [Desulfobacteraceae bacterium]
MHHHHGMPGISGKKHSHGKKHHGHGKHKEHHSKFLKHKGCKGGHAHHAVRPDRNDSDQDIVNLRDRHEKRDLIDFQARGVNLPGQADQTAWVDPSRCVGCAKCEKICPTGAIQVAEKIASVNTGLCRGCGQCVAGCKHGALFMAEYQG